jgi:hypothetical protein
MVTRNFVLINLFLLDESNHKIDLGIPLKRKTFKWRLDENISKEDLDKKRKTFWETCYTSGV